LFSKLYPYIIAGIILTSILKILITRYEIINFFKKYNNSSIFISSILGIISPLGSYVVIPLGAGLISIGISIPVVMSFLISSPLIDLNLFLLTAGAFGYNMAIARLISAFVMGVGAGYFFKFLINKNIINQTKAIINSNINITDYNYEKINIIMLFKEIWKMTKYIGKYFMISIILTAIIKIFTPDQLITKIFSNNLFISVLFSTSAGIPFYVCGGAAIPVVQQLAELGLPKGSVLAFFISGPITKVSNIILLKTIFSNKIFLFYILYGISCSIIIGIFYNLISL